MILKRLKWEKSLYLIIKKKPKLINSLLFSKYKKRVINFRSFDTFWFSKIKLLIEID
jgi:hypothetical protein